MEEELREILHDLGGLRVPAAELSVGDDLFAAGLTSFATVAVMLAIEDQFDVTLPDTFLVRATFSSLNALIAAIHAVQGEPVAQY